MSIIFQILLLVISAYYHYVQMETSLNNLVVYILMFWYQFVTYIYEVILKNKRYSQARNIRIRIQQMMKNNAMFFLR